MSGGNKYVHPGMLGDGLTKREYFAAVAMQGVLATPSPAPRSRSGEDAATRYEAQQYIAEWAVDMADALIAELAKEQP